MFQLFVEGRGENAASQKLVHKIIDFHGLGNYFFSEGRRIPNIHTDEGLKNAIEIARINSQTEGVLILRDDEDNCPKELAPQKAKFLQSLNAPFPIAYCIMYREFETLFVAYGPLFAGRTIPHAIRGEIQFKTPIPTVNPETVRGAKEWISTQFVGGRGYKPTTDQLSLTQALEIDELVNLQIPCFETLTRCVIELIKNRGNPFVYPTPA